MQPEGNPNQQQQTDGSDIHKMVVLQPGEKVICEIKRHPFGLIGQYLVAGLLFVVAISVAVFVVPQLNNVYDAQNVGLLVYGALGLMAAFALIFLMISTSIYWKNKWVVTSDSLTQILQPSLFGQQVSQLSLEDLEDITVVQSGLIQTMFNFGTLRAETAGERSKFVFIYCPTPQNYARQILAAREEFNNFKRYNEAAQHEPAYYGQNGQGNPPVSMPPESRP